MYKVILCEDTDDGAGGIMFGRSVRTAKEYKGNATIQIGSLILLNDDVGLAEEIHDWVYENCSGRFYSRGDLIFYFEEEPDAVAFKLRWI